jgi:UPF0176 protein
MSSPVHITAGYTFCPIEEKRLPTLKKELLNFGQTHSMRGLTLIATEGINGTVCGSPSAITAWKQLLIEQCGPMVFKDSTADRPVFRRWSVKIKPEIVAIKNDTVKPAGKRHHLSPQEWEKMLKDNDAIVIDTRNHFEVHVGKFRGAMDPKISRFSEFPEYVRRSGIPKDKKVMLYCTGGIRCEKALIAMEQEGYEHVFQLEGGILAYLKAFPEHAFEGECFVFDKRVAVNQLLEPSKTYGMCPHCSDPCTIQICCEHCSDQTMICQQCNMQAHRRTCSKNCAQIFLKHAQKNKLATAKSPGYGE